ncbi:flavin reductase [Amycolatopsis jejuensis]|uniref:flavin reductase n=1 Tax=Amycolatopsis jejuensis TaxID=330084 RepID=UPI000AD433FF|nr:flavin reductase [Amycolatopsis jejuensis]
MTCIEGGQVYGLTVNSFTAVSLTPPLILVSIDRRAKALERLRSNRFTVQQAAHAQH